LKNKNNFINMMRLSDNIQNIQRMNNKDDKKEEEEVKVEKQVITTYQTNTDGKEKDLEDIFDDPLHYEVFTARCHDTGELANAENARLFKEDILKRNAKASRFLKFQSLRLGVNSIIALST
jgi:hypothetical protein